MNDVAKIELGIKLLCSLAINVYCLQINSRGHKTDKAEQTPIQLAYLLLNNTQPFCIRFNVVGFLLRLMKMELIL